LNSGEFSHEGEKVNGIPSTAHIATMDSSFAAGNPAALWISVLGGELEGSTHHCTSSEENLIHGALSHSSYYFEIKLNVIHVPCMTHASGQGARVTPLLSKLQRLTGMF
jgi:hypothetical protein